MIAVKLTEEQFGFLYNYIFDSTRDCWRKYYNFDGKDVKACSLHTGLSDIQKILVRSEKLYKAKKRLPEHE